MKPTPSFPDPERAAVDLLTELLDDEDVTVGVGLPEGWTIADPTHVQVAWDGNAGDEHPVVIRPVIRVTAWCAQPSEAKRVALAARSLLLAHAGGAISSIQPGTGLLVTRDPDQRAELASFTVRLTVRAT